MPHHLVAGRRVDRGVPLHRGDEEGREGHRRRRLPDEQRRVSRIESVDANGDALREAGGSGTGRPAVSERALELRQKGGRQQRRSRSAGCGRAAARRPRRRPARDERRRSRADGSRLPRSVRSALRPGISVSAKACSVGSASRSSAGRGSDGSRAAARRRAVPRAPARPGRVPSPAGGPGGARAGRRSSRATGWSVQRRRVSPRFH